MLTVGAEVRSIMEVLSFQRVLRFTMRASAVAAMALAVSMPGLAAPTFTELTGVVSVPVQGVQQLNGEYLWTYEVNWTERHNLSNWILQICTGVDGSITKVEVDGTAVNRGPGYVYENPDPNHE